MMIDSLKIKAAAFYAIEKHQGQKRIGGAEYITHPFAVAEILSEWGYGEEYQIAGLFHDLLEDTDAKEYEVEKLGGKDVLEAVKLLTKREGYVMEEYISSIKRNPIAFAVKAADRLHNLRCALVADKKFRRKYIKESLDWYLDFSPEIEIAVKELIKSLDSQN